uniref:Stress-induced protein n=1 Tax=Ectopseudomonas mendocina (strain ymp) TaxID=399739 RepID=A4XUQ0_ECTM1
MPRRSLPLVSSPPNTPANRLNIRCRRFLQIRAGQCCPASRGDRDMNHNPGNLANDRQKASEAGKKGGRSSGGSFANDRQKATEAGRKGGRNSHGGGRT